MFRPYKLALVSTCLTLIYLQTAPGFSDECREDCEPPCVHCDRTIIAEIKASCFLPTDEKIRNIYSSAMGMYGLELSYQAWDWLYPWVSGSVITDEGRSKGFHHHTRATVVPIGLGLKGMYHFKQFGFYAGAGPLYSYLHVNDDSKFVIRSSSKWAWGGIGKAGVIFFSDNRFTVDLFADYSYMKFDFDGSGKVIRHNVNFSGWSIGGALGLAF